MSMTLEQMHRYLEAIKNNTTQQPVHATATAIADQSFQRKDWHEALAQYQLLMLHEYVLDPQSYYRVGLCFWKLKNYPEAGRIWLFLWDYVGPSEASESLIFSLMNYYRSILREPEQAKKFFNTYQATRPLWTCSVKLFREWIRTNMALHAWGEIERELQGYIAHHHYALSAFKKQSSETSNDTILDLHADLAKVYYGLNRPLEGKKLYERLHAMASYRVDTYLSEYTTLKLMEPMISQNRIFKIYEILNRLEPYQSYIHLEHALFLAQYDTIEKMRLFCSNLMDKFSVLPEYPEWIRKITVLQAWFSEDPADGYLAFQNLRMLYPDDFMMLAISIAYAFKQGDVAQATRLKVEAVLKYDTSDLYLDKLTSLSEYVILSQGMKGVMTATQRASKPLVSLSRAAQEIFQELKTMFAESSWKFLLTGSGLLACLPRENIEQNIECHDLDFMMIVPESDRASIYPKLYEKYVKSQHVPNLWKRKHECGGEFPVDLLLIEDMAALKEHGDYTIATLCCDEEGVLYDPTGLGYFHFLMNQLVPVKTPQCCLQDDICVLRAIRYELRDFKLISTLKKALLDWQPNATQQDHFQFMLYTMLTSPSRLQVIDAFKRYKMMDKVAPIHVMRSGSSEQILSQWMIACFEQKDESQKYREQRHWRMKYRIYSQSIQMIREHLEWIHLDQVWSDSVMMKEAILAEKRNKIHILRSKLSENIAHTHEKLTRAYQEVDEQHQSEWSVLNHRFFNAVEKAPLLEKKKRQLEKLNSTQGDFDAHTEKTLETTLMRIQQECKLMRERVERLNFLSSPEAAFIRKFEQKTLCPTRHLDLERWLKLTHSPMLRVEIYWQLGYRDYFEGRSIQALYRLKQFLKGAQEYFEKPTPAMVRAQQWVEQLSQQVHDDAPDMLSLRALESYRYQRFDDAKFYLEALMSFKKSAYYLDAGLLLLTIYWEEKSYAAYHQLFEKLKKQLTAKQFEIIESRMRSRNEELEAMFMVSLEEGQLVVRDHLGLRCRLWSDRLLWQKILHRQPNEANVALSPHIAAFRFNDILSSYGVLYRDTKRTMLDPSRILIEMAFLQEEMAQYEAAANTYLKLLTHTYQSSFLSSWAMIQYAAILKQDDPQSEFAAHLIAYALRQEPSLGCYQQDAAIFQNDFRTAQVDEIALDHVFEKISLAELESFYQVADIDSLRIVAGYVLLQRYRKAEQHEMALATALVLMRLTHRVIRRYEIRAEVEDTAIASLFKVRQRVIEIFPQLLHHVPDLMRFQNPEEVFEAAKTISDLSRQALYYHYAFYLSHAYVEAGFAYMRCSMQLGRVLDVMMIYADINDVPCFARQADVIHKLLQYDKKFQKYLEDTLIENIHEQTSSKVRALWRMTLISTFLDRSSTALDRILTAPTDMPLVDRLWAKIRWVAVNRTQHYAVIDEEILSVVPKAYQEYADIFRCLMPFIPEMIKSNQSVSETSIFVPPKLFQP